MQRHAAQWKGCHHPNDLAYGQCAESDRKAIDCQRNGTNRQAEDQVKLMGALMKEEGKKGRKEKGAPSMSSRDMVVRLSREGWSVEQIQQATKLSRGEVELILELQPKR